MDTDAVACVIAAAAFVPDPASTLQYPPPADQRRINSHVLTGWRAKPLDEIVKGDHIRDVIAHDVTVPVLKATNGDCKDLEFEDKLLRDKKLTHAIVMSVHYGECKLNVIGSLQKSAFDA